MRERGPILRWALLLSVAVVLQVTVVTDIEIFGVHPEVLLLLAVCSGVAAGPGTGAVVGFSAGLLMDLFLPGRFGVAALAYALAGYAAGTAAETVIRPARWITVVTVTLASAGGVLAYAVLAHLLGQATLTDPNLVPIVGIVAAVNGLLAIPSSAVCRWAAGEPSPARLR